MLQKLLQLLFAHPQFGPRLIQKLADSYPIRRAAKMTAYVYLRGKSAIEDKAKMNIEEFARTKLDEASKTASSSRFSQTFKDELKKQWDEAKRIEQQKRR